MAAKPTGTFPLQFLQSDDSQQSLFEARQKPKFLWLCIHLPDLALEVLADSKNNKPYAVFNETKNQGIIQAVSSSAEKMGVTPFMPLSAAFTLCPSLEVSPYDSYVESLQLCKIAKWAENFTSIVSLEPPRSLLLEVQGSLHLFGGLNALKEKIRKRFIQAWPHRFCLAVAPTPMASLLLARYGRETMIMEQSALRSELGRLPVDILLLDTKRLKRLRKIGAQQLHDLWRLPRDGLARRFGPDLLQYLDRVLGVLADPRDSYQVSHKFSLEIDLPMEVKSTHFILMAAKNLIEQLVTFLREGDTAVNELVFYLYHAQTPVTELKLGLRYMSRDAVQLLGLLKEHFNRFKLSSPIVKLELVCHKIYPFISRNESLFLDQTLPVDKGQDDIHWQNLLEQLQGRLGKHAISGLSVRADHRPEKAWCYGELGAFSDQAVVHVRPLWLLPRPRRFPEHLRVKIISGPERIENGWWQGQDVRRDYYTAFDKKGRRLWVFRDLTDKLWYLHGLFA